MKRIEWIDTTKAIGMFLVFYGHYIEDLIELDYSQDIAQLQFNFIYAFHMPMFFALSGFFAKKVTDKKAYTKKLFLQRIVPVFSFAILFFPLWMVYNALDTGQVLWANILEKAAMYAVGNPQLDFITWFLICLFTTELIAAFLNLVSEKKWVNLLSGVFFIIFGYYSIQYTDGFTVFPGLHLNFWYIQESIIALGFYLIGNWIFYSIKKIKHWVFYISTPLALALLILSFTYIDHTNKVVMATSDHGQIIPFLLNAFLGIVFMISLGHIIPPNRVFKFIGANTLILLGLNGVFYHFINAKLAAFIPSHDSFLFITLQCIIVSVFSILICYPGITLLNKYVPQLFGKPFADGPLLKPIHISIFNKHT
ncbi:acyltransferase family protein [Formosa algae]|uniref:Fucose 4-O-acetylase-like acetyltransferase n=1 Tax=Formosa algae TaxID=225843 RepID=A0A9X0YL07_9FLAO|nr:acyltransferase family protein [Formosa algae]MBP1839908.1 fucose 4-O-acetylase-like acetyltransferase [Formosa algae]MDQ0335507.1 fucose 4-O-acetylase-like acetyltransferase [Formosa algae]OEI81788.1 hypothetical protein AST99_02590 [Formosa algae]